MTAERPKDLVKELNESSQSEMQVMTCNMLTSIVKNTILWGPADPYRFGA